jgi:uncharacterized protein YndB with AHSA1/START domain
MPRRRSSSTPSAIPTPQTVLYGDETEPTWTVESELDLRVGGPWTIAFGRAGEDPYRETNVFSEVDRPRRIAFDSSMFMEGLVEHHRRPRARGRRQASRVESQSRKEWVG